MSKLARLVALFVLAQSSQSTQSNRDHSQRAAMEKQQQRTQYDQRKIKFKNGEYEGDITSVCCQGKDISCVRFELVGGSCSNSDHSQGCKFSCSGHSYISTSQSATIIVKPHDLVLSFGLSSMEIFPSDNAEFSIYHKEEGKNKFPTTAEIQIIQSNGIVQSLDISTSCSEPLSMGDQFGSLKLVGYCVDPTGPNADICITPEPSLSPSLFPTLIPSSKPSSSPTLMPSSTPSRSYSPTLSPSSRPSVAPFPGMLCQCQENPPPQYEKANVEALIFKYEGGDCSENKQLTNNGGSCHDSNGSPKGIAEVRVEFYSQFGEALMTNPANGIVEVGDELTVYAPGIQAFPDTSHRRNQLLMRKAKKDFRKLGKKRIRKGKQGDGEKQGGDKEEGGGEEGEEGEEGKFNSKIFVIIRGESAQVLQKQEILASCSQPQTRIEKGDIYGALKLTSTNGSGACFDLISR